MKDYSEYRMTVRSLAETAIDQAVEYLEREGEEISVESVFDAIEYNDFVCSVIDNSQYSIYHEYNLPILDFAGAEHIEEAYEVYREANIDYFDSFMSALSGYALYLEVSALALDTDYIDGYLPTAYYVK